MQASAAAEFERGFVAALRLLGWDVTTQVAVPYDGRMGRVDVVARKDGEVLAVELDRLRPRRKSLAKLSRLAGTTEAMVVCRGGTVVPVKPGSAAGSLAGVYTPPAYAPPSAADLRDAEAAKRASGDLLWFVLRMERLGFEVRPNISTRSHRFHGFRFVREGRSFTGCAIGATPARLAGTSLAYEPRRHAEGLRARMRAARRRATSGERAGRL